MERLSRGDIWIVESDRFPKPRPALIMSIDAINDLCPEVVIVPITTKPGPLRVPFTMPESATGLSVASFGKCEAIGTIYKRCLKTKIGALRGTDLEPFESGVRRVLGLRRPAVNGAEGPAPVPGAT